MINPDTSKALDDEVGPVVESFLRRFRTGERPALTELVARYPDLAEQLNEIIPALVELEQLGAATGSFSGSRADREGEFEANQPRQLGDYRILRRIGGGGMGVVYEAEHQSLKSRVALKVMHPRFRTDEKYIRRFHIEARSAAGLHHTNIVSVFDYGEQDGVCYYAMQYIKGQPLDCVLTDLRRLRANGERSILLDALEPRPAPALPATHAPRSVALGLMTGRFVLDETAGLATAETELIESSFVHDHSPRPIESHDVEESSTDRESLSFGSSSLGGSAETQYFREVARICAQVADALDHAHRSGVLHRDIKPPNLLLDGLGNVWVTDFGLAKLEEGEDTSQSQDLVGTLRYMAPERFQGISNRRGDIYALGATLYELITLQPAFGGNDQLRLIDRIVHEPPERPRQIDRQVPRDLETIVLKALAKDPKDRFTSARELAEELRQFIAGHPIQSRPITSIERFWRWCKRDPWLAGANVAAAVLTTVLAIGALTAAYVYRSQVVDLEKSRNLIKDAVLDARQRAVEAYIAQADAGRFSHRPGQRFNSLHAINEATQLLDGLGHSPAEGKSRESLRDLAIAAMALPDLRVGRTFGKSSEKSRFLDFDPAFERFVVSDNAGDSVMYRVDNGAELFRFSNPSQSHECWPLFDPHGRFLALMIGDGALQIWQVDGPSPVLIADKPARTCLPGNVSFRDDGDALVFVTCDYQFAWIDLKSGQSRILPLGVGKANRLAFHPDGRRLVTVKSVDGKFVAELRTLDDATPLATLDLPAAMSDVAWSPDGVRVAMAGEDSRIYVWEPDRPTATPLILPILNNMGLTIAFNHRGDLLASDGWDGILRLWDPRTGRLLLSTQTYAKLRFSLDDRHLGICRAGDSFQSFDVTSGRELRSLPGDPSADRVPTHLVFEPNGPILAARTRKGVQLWDTEAAEPIAVLDNLGWSMPRFEADGGLLTFGSPGLIRWPIHREGGRQSMGPPRFLHNLKPAGGNLASSRDGNVLLLAGLKQPAITLTGKAPARLKSLSPQNDVRWGALSPDGHWAATVSYLGQETGVVIWEAKTGRRVTMLDSALRSSIEFSPDGRWLATSQDSCKLWEVGTWRLAREIPVDSGDIAFSPDSSTLALCSQNQIRLHDVATARHLATLEPPSQGASTHPAFSHDGNHLALTDAQTHEILIWDLRLIRSQLAAMGLDWGDRSSTGAAPDFSAALPSRAIRLEVQGASQANLHRIEARFELKKSVRLIRRLFAARLDTPEEHHGRCHQWMLLQQFAPALADAEQALAAQPNDPHLNLLVGTSAYECGDDVRAIAALNLAIKGNPNDGETANSLAWALLNTALSQRDPAQALDLARKVMKANPGNANYRNTLVLALARMGLDAEAVSTIETAPQHLPWDDLAIAPCYFRLGKTAQARESLNSALRWRASIKMLTPRQETDFRNLADEVQGILSTAP